MLTENNHQIELSPQQNCSERKITSERKSESLTYKKERQTKNCKHVNFLKKNIT